MYVLYHNLSPLPNFYMGPSTRTAQRAVHQAPASSPTDVELCKCEVFPHKRYGRTVPAVECSKTTNSHANGYKITNNQFPIIVP